MNLLCRIGLHKWRWVKLVGKKSEPEHWLLIEKWLRECESCGKKQHKERWRPMVYA
jgi:hypothetical protein